MWNYCNTVWVNGLDQTFKTVDNSLFVHCVPADLLHWSTIKQPCCWVVLVMLWDTGTSCGSTMSRDQPFTRSVQDQHRQWVCGKTKPLLKCLALSFLSLQELKELGGLKNIKAELPDWPVSDDTVLHLATAEGLATGEVKMTLNPFSVSPVLVLFHTRNWLDWSDSQCRADEASSGHTNTTPSASWDSTKG